MKKQTLFFLLLAACISLNAQTPEHSHSHGRKIEFPDIPGYRTLKCDFHIHTVFSDGNVWPTIRVEEALKDGLDAISMTDHIEYQPHKDDIPHPDRNRSFEIAKRFAEAYDILVIRGSEITRSMPPGHFNAIFLEDANKLKVEDVFESFREAKRQGAYVFWNHPNWTAQRPDGITRFDDLHLQLLKEGLFQGIEVVNDITYSDESLQMALENNLTIMGTSDIHGLVDWQFEVPEGGHRPITLVMATGKTPESIKEALLAGRTIAWFNNLLIGKEEYVKPLVMASLKIKSATYPGKTSVARIEIENTSDADLQLRNQSPYTFHANSDVLTLKSHEVTTLEVKTLERKDSIELPFEVLNAVVAPNLHPSIQLTVKME
ncbi:MAG: PHP domain-containing protein [Lewinellaceae bacterium]|nr:PHP domain-containing protein [Lewinellaceae bacterium]